MATILMGRQAGLLVVKKIAVVGLLRGMLLDVVATRVRVASWDLGEFCDLCLQTLERMSSNDWCNLSRSLVTIVKVGTQVQIQTVSPGKPTCG